MTLLAPTVGGASPSTETDLDASWEALVPVLPVVKEVRLCSWLRLTVRSTEPDSGYGLLFLLPPLIFLCLLGRSVSEEDLKLASLRTHVEKGRRPLV